MDQTSSEAGEYVTYGHHRATLCRLSPWIDSGLLGGMRLVLGVICVALVGACEPPPAPPYSETVDLTVPITTAPSEATMLLRSASTQTNWANVVQRAHAQLGNRFMVVLSAADLSVAGGSCTDAIPVVADDVFLAFEDTAGNRIVGLSLPTPLQFTSPAAFDIAIQNAFGATFDSADEVSSPRPFLITLRLGRSDVTWKTYCTPESVILRMTFLATHTNNFE